MHIQRKGLRSFLFCNINTSPPLSPFLKRNDPFGDKHQNLDHMTWDTSRLVPGCCQWKGIATKRRQLLGEKLKARDTPDNDSCVVLYWSCAGDCTERKKGKKKPYPLPSMYQCFPVLCRLCGGDTIPVVLIKFDVQCEKYLQFSFILRCSMIYEKVKFVLIFLMLRFNT